MEEAPTLHAPLLLVESLEEEAVEVDLVAGLDLVSAVEADLENRISQVDN